jgi:hypothetical protein
MKSDHEYMHEAVHTTEVYLSGALKMCETMQIEPTPELLTALVRTMAADFDTAMRIKYPKGM